MLNKNVATETKVIDFDYVPVSKISEVTPFISSGAVRQHIFYNTRGFRDKDIRLFGKRQFIKISALKDWIEEQNAEGGKHDR